MAKKSENQSKTSKKSVKARLGRIAAKSAATEEKSAKKTIKNILSAASAKPERKPAAKAVPAVDTVKQKIVEPRKPHATRPTAAELPEILERQNLVMDLKTNGVSFRRIEKRLKDLGYDVSLGTVHADYVASLTRLQATNISQTELLVAEELNKLEDWEFDLNALKTRRNLSVYEVVALKGALVMIQNQRDKFLALSKPKVIKIQTESEFAKKLGISPEELPDGDESGD